MTIPVIAIFIWGCWWIASPKSSLIYQKNFSQLENNSFAILFFLTFVYLFKAKSLRASCIGFSFDLVENVEVLREWTFCLILWKPLDSILSLYMARRRARDRIRSKPNAISWIAGNWWGWEKYTRYTIIRGRFFGRYLEIEMVMWTELKENKNCQ